MTILRELLQNRRWIYVHSLEYINKILKVMIIIYTNTQSTKGLVPQVLTRIYLRKLIYNSRFNRWKGGGVPFTIEVFNW